jgi:hypothetical protein
MAITRIASKRLKENASEKFTLVELGFFIFGASYVKH